MSTSPTLAGGPPPRRLRIFASPVFWAVVVLCAVAVPGVRVLITKRAAAELPVLGTLPTFTLTDQNGAAFGTGQLEGRVWVANFIFTRCPTICPAFTRKMYRVQQSAKDLAPALHLVSFSVDPDYDKPEVLKAYAQTHGADTSMWSFLTGDPAAIQKTVVDGLKVSMGRSGDADDVNSIFHGTHFVLVDGQMRIRGYYRSEDDAEVQRLLTDLRALVESSPSRALAARSGR